MVFFSRTGLKRSSDALNCSSKHMPAVPLLVLSSLELAQQASEPCGVAVHAGSSMKAVQPVLSALVVRLPLKEKKKKTQMSV